MLIFIEWSCSRCCQSLKDHAPSNQLQDLLTIWWGVSLSTLTCCFDACFSTTGPQSPVLCRVHLKYMSFKCSYKINFTRELHLEQEEEFSRLTFLWFAFSIFQAFYWNKLEFYHKQLSRRWAPSRRLVQQMLRFIALWVLHWASSSPWKQEVVADVPPNHVPSVSTINWPCLDSHVHAPILTRISIALCWRWCVVAPSCCSLSSINLSPFKNKKYEIASFVLFISFTQIMCAVCYSAFSLPGISVNLYQLERRLHVKLLFLEKNWTGHNDVFWLCNKSPSGLQINDDK